MGAGRGLLRSGLVVSEIALSFVPLIGAGLLMKAFLKLQSTPTGIRSENLLTFRVSPPLKRFTSAPLYESFYQPVLDRLRQVPGVRSAGAISLLPLQDWGWNGEFEIEGRPPEAPGRQPFTEWRFITPGYVSSMGIALRNGRDVSETDTGKSPPVALVNETLARQYFPQEDPIGKHIRSGPGDWLTIVGVVGDVRQSGIDKPARAETYLPLSQSPELAKNYTEMAIVIAAETEPTALTSAARRAVMAVLPDQPIFGVTTMEKVISEMLSSHRLNLALIGLFALIAMTLACAGVYGVLSYVVAQRTREFGVRMALDASTADVLRGVMNDSAVLAGIGVVVGTVGALVLARVLQGLLFDVKTYDPAVYGIVAALMLTIIAAASLVPARRATKVDPMVALRWE